MSRDECGQPPSLVPRRSDGGRGSPRRGRTWDCRDGAVPARSAVKGTAGARSAPERLRLNRSLLREALARPGPRQRAPKTRLHFQQTRPGETAQQQQQRERGLESGAMSRGILGMFSPLPGPNQQLEFQEGAGVNLFISCTPCKASKQHLRFISLKIHIYISNGVERTRLRST